MSGCCPSNTNKPWWQRIDIILWLSLSVLVLPLGLQFYSPWSATLAPLAHDVTGLFGQIWWGMLMAFLAVGMLGLIPQPLVLKTLGHKTGFQGLWRAVLAGLLFDLCSHGIALVGVQLYRKGARLSQVFAFLIASPWNSLSTSLIMLSLLGWGWTLTFIVLSLVVALVTGLVVDALEQRGVIQHNPHAEKPAAADEAQTWGAFWHSLRFHPRYLPSFIGRCWQANKSLMKWLFLGLALTALVRSYVPADVLQTWFGPTLLGLGATLAMATVLEVCSEGSVPLGAELVTAANAPGNAFTFLMAGIATDVTELLLLRGVVGNWHTVLWLPLLTVPQVVVLGWVLNQF